MGSSRTALMLILLVLVANVIAMNHFLAVARGSEGPNLDLYCDRGGIGPNMSCDDYYCTEKMFLFGNATYSNWPESQRDVAFQILEPNGSTVAIFYSRTDAFGIASVNWSLPYTDGELYGNWTILGTVSIGGVVVRDTLHFQYLLHRHDIHVTSIVTGKTIIGKGSPLTVDVGLFDSGNVTATCFVTAFANEVIILNQVECSVSNQSFAVLTFAWNTSDFAFGNCTLRAFAEPVPGPKCVDNIGAVNQVIITILGDANADFQVDIFDALIIARSFCSNANCTLQNPNADLNNDRIVDIFDAMLLAKNFGKSVSIGTGF